MSVDCLSNNDRLPSVDTSWRSLPQPALRQPDDGGKPFYLKSKRSMLRPFSLTVRREVGVAV
jgi:hypothetical protein